ncbi:MAG: phage tail assembly protein [Chloroflexia bacterium]
MALQTEFEFTLPKGYIDEEGNLHRHGIMRLATALDEIAPLRDPRVRANEAYLVIILLSRVITRLGTLPDVNPHVIEGLFTGDLAYLQEFYQRINGDGSTVFPVKCPGCGTEFEVDLSRPGGV